MLIRLYESLVKNTLEKFEFVIIDNGSTIQEVGGLLRYCDERYDLVDLDKEKDIHTYLDDKKNVIKIQFLEKNIGFSAGNNVGLKLVNTNDFVVFINSDIIVNEKDWDKKFKTELEKENVAVVGCAYHPLKWDRNGNFHIQPIPNEPVESESVQGAFFAVRKDVLEEIKENDMFFDEINFPMAHYEETDAILRIMKKGYKCVWCPCSHTHDHHRSSTKHNGFKLNENIRNEAEFKAHSNRNKQNLLKKHKDWFDKK
jgi:GT2 family glycosyltransferase